MGAEIPKQYLPLSGRTVLARSIERILACERIAGVVVVVAATDGFWPQVLAEFPSGRIYSAEGGAERCHSVLAGLHALSRLAAESDWVLVHDAARPCVRVGDVERLIDVLFEDPLGGLLATPVRDTMKRTGGDERVVQTVEREDLWHALTPQMFRYGLLFEALKSTLESGDWVTDEAAAMERAGHHPRVVEGGGDNIKVTHRDDLAIAEFLLSRQAGE